MAATQGAPALVDLATTITKSVTEGVPAKGSIGGKGVALGWAGGLARGFWSFVQTASTEGGSLSLLRVAPSGTPAIKVAEGGTKPAGVTLTPRTITLAKYAGTGSCTLEQSSYNAGVAGSIAATLVNSALLALEVDLAAEAVAQASANVTGDTTWTAAILRGIGAVVANGGKPDLLAMAPADFAKALGTSPPSLVFAGPDEVLSYLGLALHVSPGLTPGTAIVMDSSAMIVTEHSTSPLVLVDPFSGAATNTTRIVVDILASGFVSHPGSVVKLTPTVALADAASTSRSK